MAWGTTAKGRANITAIAMMTPLMCKPDHSIGADDRQNVLYLSIAFHGVLGTTSKSRLYNTLSLTIGVNL